jgi:hypothetical protein
LAQVNLASRPQKKKKKKPKAKAGEAEKVEEGD